MLDSMSDNDFVGGCVSIEARKGRICDLKENRESGWQVFMGCIFKLWMKSPKYTLEKSAENVRKPTGDTCVWVTICT